MALNPTLAHKIGERPSAADPSVTEYFNKENNIGFDTPQSLFGYASTILQKPVGSFEDIQLNPTQILNQAQQNAFDSIKSSPVSDPNALRETASQAIGDNINSFQTQIQSIQKRQEELLGSLSSYFQSSPNEQKLNADLNNLDTSYEMGQNKIEDKVIPMEYITGQQASNERRYVQQRNTLVKQLQSETATRQQKLEAAKFLYDANRNSISDTITLFKTTQPDNLGTYTTATGDMYATFKNPVTGAITKQLLGNTGNPEAWKQNLQEATALGVPPNFEFYMKGLEIRSNVTGQGFPTWEAFLAAGGKADLSNVYKPDGQLPVKFETKEIAGQYVHIGYNAAGKVVSQEVLGDAGKPGTGKASSGSSSSRSSGVSTPAVTNYGFTAFPKTASTNNIRNWLLANWHRKAGQPYYDVWGQAADILTENGLDPSKFDDTFWAVFRPGEKSKRSS